MTSSYLRLNRIAYFGSQKQSKLTFRDGVNVICGASDTGKSFLAESIDFMLGGSELRDIPERKPYEEIQLDIAIDSAEIWRFHRATKGGNFRAEKLKENGTREMNLRWQHSHSKTDNISGFLLDQIGLKGKRILRSKAKGTTQSLSFRNLARLIIVQEGEIQQSGSPFWGGQYTLKTPEMAAVTLLLTGVDDSAILSTEKHIARNNNTQIELIDELLEEIQKELFDIGEEREDIEEQLNQFDSLIETRRESLDAAQREFGMLSTQRRKLVKHCTSIQNRIDEIADHLTRFELLSKHYRVDEERLEAIVESSLVFAHFETVSCPLCGAPPHVQRHHEACDGDIDAVVAAATAEIEKIERLKVELQNTVKELERESNQLKTTLSGKNQQVERLSAEIQETVAPDVAEERSFFSELIERRSGVQKALHFFDQAESLEARKNDLIHEGQVGEPKKSITTSFPESIAHQISLKVSSLLRDWDFPGECKVYFDKVATDFVIDGKPRASRGKGLRAITHAAVTISLLEYCRENNLPHPGFVVIDSPLLAYFKPEGDDDMELQGTNLKEQFYQYLIDHHSEESQIIIIENQHPPDFVLGGLKMTIFTGNPNEGRQGLL